MVSAHKTCLMKKDCIISNVNKLSQCFAQNFNTFKRKRFFLKDTSRNWGHKMLTLYFTVWPGIPTNSSFARATQCLLRNGPNYNMQQPPLAAILNLYLFLRAHMRTFHCSQPLYKKGKRKSFTMKAPHTLTHWMCRSVLRGTFTIKRIMVTYQYLLQGAYLFFPRHPSLTQKYNMCNFRNAIFETTLDPWSADNQLGAFPWDVFS